MAICQIIGKYCKVKLKCVVAGISCGSLIANMTIEMEQEEIQDSNSTAPENIEEFRQQISAIKYDPDIGQL